MSSLFVKSEVISRLDSLWTTTRIIDFENNQVDLNTSFEPWISPMFLGAPEEQIGLGEASPARYWREEGIVHFLIGVPAMTGWRTCDTYARQLSILFRGVAITDALVFKSVSAPQLYTQNQEILGNWFIKAILADYQYTYTDPA